MRPNGRIAPAPHMPLRTHAGCSRHLGGAGLYPARRPYLPASPKAQEGCALGRWVTDGSHEKRHREACP
jgi:hypothetical protein